MRRIAVRARAQVQPVHHGGLKLTDRALPHAAQEAALRSQPHDPDAQRKGGKVRKVKVMEVAAHAQLQPAREVVGPLNLRRAVKAPEGVVPVKAEGTRRMARREILRGNPKMRQMAGRPRGHEQDDGLHGVRVGEAPKRRKNHLDGRGLRVEAVEERAGKPKLLLRLKSFPTARGICAYCELL